MTDNLVVRGFIASIDVMPALIVTFQFNPTSISDNKAANYADPKAGPSDAPPRKEYRGGGYRTISFDLKLYGLEQGANILNPLPVDNGVSTELAKLRSFMYPKSDAWAITTIGSKDGKRLNAPPTCIFGFGTKVLQCVMTDLTITETQFNSALAPVKADVKITLMVIEETSNKFYIVDRERRNTLAAVGWQNIRLF